ncbi:MAG: type II toxin-antitoxin system PemK/MazF family toxin [Candidatus Absconditabacteria bacterium]
MQTIDIDESFFDLWNCEKKQLNKSKRIVYPKPKEIWYIKIGVNVGKEIFGKDGFFRPVLVVSKIGNMFFCLPMTTKGKNLSYCLQLFSVFESKESYLVINQGRTFDTQRFFTKIGKVSLEEFMQIKKLLRLRYFPEAF